MSLHCVSIPHTHTLQGIQSKSAAKCQRTCTKWNFSNPLLLIVHVEFLDKAPCGLHFYPQIYIVCSGPAKRRDFNLLRNVCTSEHYHQWTLRLMIRKSRAFCIIFGVTDLSTLQTHTHCICRLISHSYRFHIDVVLLFTTGKRKRDTKKTPKIHTHNTNFAQVTKIKHKAKEMKKSLQRTTAAECFAVF